MEALETPLRVAGLDDEVLALDVAEIAEPLPKDLLQGSGRHGRTGTEATNPIHFRGLLCLGGERQQEDAEGEEDEASDRGALHGGLLRVR
jgi:hypothetical protein